MYFDMARVWRMDDEEGESERHQCTKRTLEVKMRINYWHKNSDQAVENRIVRA